MFHNLNCSPSSSTSSSRRKKSLKSRKPVLCFQTPCLRICCRINWFKNIWFPLNISIFFLLWDELLSFVTPSRLLSIFISASMISIAFVSFDIIITIRIIFLLFSCNSFSWWTSSITRVLIFDRLATLFILADWFIFFFRLLSSDLWFLLCYFPYVLSSLLYSSKNVLNEMPPNSNKPK